MTGIPDHDKYSPTEQMTPGYSWRSSATPKRLTRTDTSFIPQTKKTNVASNAWFALFVALCVVLAGIYAERYHKREFKRALKSVKQLIDY